MQYTCCILSIASVSQVWIHKSIFPAPKNNFDIILEKCIKLNTIKHDISMPRQNCTSHKNVLFWTLKDFWPYPMVQIPMYNVRNFLNFSLIPIIIWGIILIGLVSRIIKYQNFIDF